MKLEFCCNYSIELEKCDIDYLTAAFKKLLVMLLAAFLKSAMEQFAVHYMRQEVKPFSCKCGNNRGFTWKTKDAKDMKISTIFAPLTLPQMQVECSVCRRKMFISRPILGIGRYQKMSTVTEKILALTGVLATFRVSEKILGMFGLELNRMTVWRCVQKVGKSISFDLDLKSLPIGEADGTGIPVRGIRKRGQELKVFIQRKLGGGARVAGLAIGKYDSGWEALFEPLREKILKFKEFLLITDGDTSIFKGMKCVNVFLQRCLWHIPHQLKHCLWSDGVKRKSADWLAIMGKIFDITSVRTLMEKEEIAAVLKEKLSRLDKLISFCEKRGYNACASYLLNAKPDMFASMEKRLNGKSSSLAERVMRTVNLRVNVGKWTSSGAINAMNVRLAHYYNGWTPGAPEAKSVRIRRL